MMGYGEEKGVIPLVCAELFARAERTKEERKGKYEYTVETSYIEIYNEKVRDLLNPKNKGCVERPLFFFFFLCQKAGLTRNLFVIILQQLASPRASEFRAVR